MSTIAKVFIVLAIIAVVLLISRCGSHDRSDCESLRNTYGDASLEYQNCLSSQRSGIGSGYRGGGGSFGGFSSGGSHK